MSNSEFAGAIVVIILLATYGTVLGISTPNKHHHHNLSTADQTTNNNNNLGIQVLTDNWTTWEINYCCPLFPPSYAPPGSIPPFNGSHSFQLDNTTCNIPSIGWGAYVRAVGPIPSTPHLTVNLLKDGNVIASNIIKDKRLTDYTLIDMSVKGTC